MASNTQQVSAVLNWSFNSDYYQLTTESDTEMTPLFLA